MRKPSRPRLQAEVRGAEESPQPAQDSVGRGPEGLGAWGGGPVPGKAGLQLFFTEEAIGGLESGRGRGDGSCQA